MKGFRLRRPNTTIRRAAFFGACLIIGSFALGSETHAQATPSGTSASGMLAGLDGLKFTGPFGAEGEKNPKQDSFTFKDGKFSTASCLEWGFSPAPFWVRRDAAGLHFLAELKSPEHGTMRYEGVFDGSKLTVVGYWKKERWYWTIERTYRGEGRLPKPVSR